MSRDRPSVIGTWCSFLIVSHAQMSSKAVKHSPRDMATSASGASAAPATPYEI